MAEEEGGAEDTSFLRTVSNTTAILHRTPSAPGRGAVTFCQSSSYWCFLLRT